MDLRPFAVRGAVGPGGRRLLLPAPAASRAPPGLLLRLLRCGRLRLRFRLRLCFGLCLRLRLGLDFGLDLRLDGWNRLVGLRLALPRRRLARRLLGLALGRDRSPRAAAALSDERRVGDAVQSRARRAPSPACRRAGAPSPTYDRVDRRASPRRALRVVQADLDELDARSLDPSCDRALRGEALDRFPSPSSVEVVGRQVVARLEEAPAGSRCSSSASREAPGPIRIPATREGSSIV